jgi:hypothetical protein
MKNVVVLILVAGIAISLGACRKKKVGSIRDNITQGTWRVTRFSDDDVEKTFKYTGDIFAFEASSIVTVNGSHTVNGSWSVQKENGSGLFGNRIGFTLLLGDPLPDLSGNWEVESFSETRLELKKDGSGDGEDVLVFEQN